MKAMVLAVWMASLTVGFALLGLSNLDLSRSRQFIQLPIDDDTCYRIESSQNLAVSVARCSDSLPAFPLLPKDRHLTQIEALTL